MIRLLIATRNRHKVAEIQAILGPGFACETLDNYSGAPVAVEDAATFAGNAMKKAQAIAGWLKKNSSLNPKPDHVIADDSGLEVDALGGAPGIHSARFAALDARAPGNSPDADNNAKLLRLLQDVPLEKRRGRFRCAIALVALDDPTRAKIFEGVCEGRIGFNYSGRAGFGYDPLFTPVGFEKTFAELGDEVKNVLSHRARALAQLKAAFPGRNSNCSGRNPV